LDPASVRPVEVTLAGRDVTVLTAGGVFSPKRIDPGTAVLLRTLARRDFRSELPATGRLVDVGCGWGPLALTMALLAPLAQVTAVDVNEAARELTRVNAQRLGLGNVAVRGAAAAGAAGVVDVIWSNPPIRIGQTRLHALLESWLGRLAPGGRADLVVQRHLGADSLQAWLTASGFPAERLASAKGYRVLRVRPRDQGESGA
jgi:16S rRNA G1207 methylase RsmC